MSSLSRENDHNTGDETMRMTDDKSKNITTMETANEMSKESENCFIEGVSGGQNEMHFGSSKTFSMPLSKNDWESKQDSLNYQLDPGIESSKESTDSEKESCAIQMRQRSNTVSIPNSHGRFSCLQVETSSKIRTANLNVKACSFEENFSDLPFRGEFCEFRQRSYTMWDPLNAREIRGELSRRLNVSSNSITETKEEKEVSSPLSPLFADNMVSQGTGKMQSPNDSFADFSFKEHDPKRNSSINSMESINSEAESCMINTRKRSNTVSVPNARRFSRLRVDAPRSKDTTLVNIELRRTIQNLPAQQDPMNFNDIGEFRQRSYTMTDARKLRRKLRRRNVSLQSSLSTNNINETKEEEESSITSSPVFVGTKRSQDIEKILSPDDVFADFRFKEHDPGIKSLMNSMESVNSDTESCPIHSRKRSNTVSVPNARKGFSRLRFDTSCNLETATGNIKSRRIVLNLPELPSPNWNDQSEFRQRSNTMTDFENARKMRGKFERRHNVSLQSSFSSNSMNPTEEMTDDIRTSLQSLSNVLDPPEIVQQSETKGKEESLMSKADSYDGNLNESKNAEDSSNLRNDEEEAPPNSDQRNDNRDQDSVLVDKDEMNSDVGKAREDRIMNSSVNATPSLDAMKAYRKHSSLLKKRNNWFRRCHHRNLSPYVLKSRVKGGDITRKSKLLNTLRPKMTSLFSRRKQASSCNEYPHSSRSSRKSRLSLYLAEKYRESPPYVLDAHLKISK